MSMERLFRVRCDHPAGCHLVVASVATSPEDARQLAQQMGWDLGPRNHPRIKGRVEHTDFCPQHKPQED